MKETVIYALRDKDQNIRYIGKSVEVERRVYNHKREREWVFDFIVLERIPLELRWQEREIYWISFFKELGCFLENITEGGEGPVHGRLLTTETKLKIAKTLAGKKRSASVIAKMSKSLRGKAMRPETKVLISKALTGHIKTLEHRQNLSKALRGKSTLSTEALGRMKKTLTGRKLSESHVENLRKAMFLRYQSKEARELTAIATKEGMRRKKENLINAEN